MQKTMMGYLVVVGLCNLQTVLGTYELFVSPLFHHQISTCIENVKFQAVTVVLLPATSCGK